MNLFTFDISRATFVKNKVGDIFAFSVLVGVVVGRGLHLDGVGPGDAEELGDLADDGLVDHGHGRLLDDDELVPDLLEDDVPQEGHDLVDDLGLEAGEGGEAAGGGLGAEGGGDEGADAGGDGADEGGLGGNVGGALVLAGDICERKLNLVDDRSADVQNG